MKTRRTYSRGEVLAARVLAVAALLCLILVSGAPALAQSTPPAPSTTDQPAAIPSSGTITGSVTDQTGAPIAGARVQLKREDQSALQEVFTNEDGRFSFANVPSGPFQLTVTSEGLLTQTVSGTLQAGESFVAPPVSLVVASTRTEVRVSPIAEAEAQINEEEKQRVLGFVPNFYVTYVRDALPLTTRQKFELAWKSSIDPVSFGVTAAIAGIEQAQNTYSAYGQGAEGYGKRFGAAYADFAVGTFVGGALLPSLLKQDPRYFYKGTGSKRSRLRYALATAFICKGDNGHWQPNYSNMLGSLAAGGISNLYYPASDRNGARLTFENAAIAIAASAGVNVLQEFVVRKLTPHSGAANP